MIQQQHKQQLTNNESNTSMRFWIIYPLSYLSKVYDTICIKTHTQHITYSLPTKLGLHTMYVRVHVKSIHMHRNTQTYIHILQPIYIFQITTLSQTCQRERTQWHNVRQKFQCSMCPQFALVNAANCVLHRPTSQVIHR